MNPTGTSGQGGRTPHQDWDVTVALLDQRVDKLEQEDCTKALADVRVEIGKLQVQTYVTWVLLILILTGLVTVAFSVWNGG